MTSAVTDVTSSISQLKVSASTDAGKENSAQQSSVRLHLLRTRRAHFGLLRTRAASRLPA